MGAPRLLTSQPERVHRRATPLDYRRTGLQAHPCILTEYRTGLETRPTNYCVVVESIVLPLKIAIQTACLNLPLRAALEQAKRLGAEAVELDARQELNLTELSRTGVRQIRKWLDDLELRVVALSFLTRRGYNVADELDRRVDATRQALAIAQQLGAPWVINQVGYVPDDPADASFALLVEVLRDLGHAGQRLGAVLCAETGSESGPALKRLYDALPVGALGIALDPGNLIVNGHSVDDALAALGSEVCHVHVHDGVRDRAAGRGMEVTLGRGSVDWPSMFGALEERNYRGWFSLERRGASDPVRELGAGVQFLRQL